MVPGFFFFLFPAQNWHCGCESGGSVRFSGDLELCGRFGLLVAVGLPAYRKCRLPFPTPSLPVKAANVSLWLIMRYTSRAVYLQVCETALCIHREAIHNITGDLLFTNLSIVRDVDVLSRFLGPGFLACHVLSCVPGCDPIFSADVKLLLLALPAVFIDVLSAVV